MSRWLCHYSVRTTTGSPQSAISNPVPLCFLCRNRNIYLKPFCNLREPELQNKIMKQHRRMPPPDSRTHHKSLLIKVAWHWHDNKWNQRNDIDSPWGTLVCVFSWPSGGSQGTQWGRTVSSANDVWDSWMFMCGRTELGPPLYKIHSRTD